MPSSDRSIAADELNIPLKAGSDSWYGGSGFFGVSVAQRESAAGVRRHSSSATHTSVVPAPSNTREWPDDILHAAVAQQSPANAVSIEVDQ